MQRALRAAALLVLACATAAAQTGPVAEIEARLPTLSGIERARALAKLAKLLGSDDPKRALEYGKQALESAPPGDDALRSDILAERSWAHNLLSQYDEAVAAAEESARLASKLGDEARRAYALNYLGSIAARRGDPVRAIEIFTQAQDTARSVGDQSNLAMALNNLGYVHSADLADYSRGLEYHLQALAIREQLRDDKAIALSLNNIGIIYYRLRQYPEALDYFGRALALRRRSGPALRVAATLHNIGDVHLDRGDLDQALAAHQEALELRTQVGDRSSMSLAHQAMGLVYLKMKRLGDAEREMTEALRVSDAVGDKGLAISNRLGLSAVERQAGRPEQALARASEALDLAVASGGRELRRRSLEELAAAQEAAGRPGAALATYREFKRVNDEVLDEGTARRVASLEKRFEIDARERQMERIVATRSRQRDAAAGALLLLGLGGFVWHRRRVERTRLLERLSTTDALTGLKNRRYLHQTVGADAAASLRRHRVGGREGGAPDDADLVFFLVDIDHFKAINDSYGHGAGDRVLVGLARRLESACRESDLVVRWGGEEFLVVARFTNRSQATAQAERLRHSLADEPFRLEDGRSLAVTGSIGFAAFPFAPRDPESLNWEQVQGIADHANYLAKRAGRNSWFGVSWADGPLPAERPTPDTVDAWIAQGLATLESRTESS